MLQAYKAYLHIKRTYDFMMEMDSKIEWITETIGKDPSDFFTLNDIDDKR